MSKLSHSNPATIDQIEARALARKGIYRCDRCEWEGKIYYQYRDRPIEPGADGELVWDDITCPNCYGEGFVDGEPAP